MKKMFLILLLIISFIGHAHNSDKDKKNSKTVSGKVFDVNGESVPGARLYVSETGEEFFADLEGHFQFTLLKSENYTVTIDGPGYLPLKVKSSEINAFSAFSLNPL